MESEFQKYKINITLLIKNYNKKRAFLGSFFTYLSVLKKGIYLLFKKIKKIKENKFKHNLIIKYLTKKVNRLINQ